MRSPTIDNTRGLLIVLVVFGHLIESVIGSHPISRAVYFAVYYFHIPAFALLSGAVSKPASSIGEWWDKNRELITAFIVFDVLYEILHFATTGTPSGYITSAQPYWLLWYLWSLAIWRLLLVWCSGTLMTVIAATIAGCLIGCLDYTPLPLGISRTVVFLPFFLIGFYMRNHLTNLEPGLLLRTVSIVIFAGCIPLAFFTMSINVEWLYGTHSYPSLDVNCLTGIIMRGLLYLISGLLSITLITLIPRAHVPLGTLGVNSLYVFVWHGFAVQLISWSKLPISLADDSDIAFVIAAFVFALAFSKIASLPAVANGTRLLITGRRGSY